MHGHQWGDTESVLPKMQTGLGFGSWEASSEPPEDVLLEQSVCVCLVISDYIYANCRLVCVSADSLSKPVRTQPPSLSACWSLLGNPPAPERWPQCGGIQANLVSAEHGQTSLVPTDSSRAGLATTILKNTNLIL